MDLMQRVYKIRKEVGAMNDSALTKVLQSEHLVDEEYGIGFHSIQEEHVYFRPLKEQSWKSELKQDDVTKGNKEFTLFRNLCGIACKYGIHMDALPEGFTLFPRDFEDYGVKINPRFLEVVMGRLQREGMGYVGEKKSQRKEIGNEREEVFDKQLQTALYLKRHSRRRREHYGVSKESVSFGTHMGSSLKPYALVDRLLEDVTSVVYET